MTDKPKLLIKNHLFAKLKTAIFLSVSCPVPALASTAVLVVTPHGIVVSTDSKVTITNAAHQQVGESTTTSKFFIVQNRIVVASIGETDIPRDDSLLPANSARYHFLAWMKDLQAALPDNISIEDLAATIERESARKFAGFEDGVLKRGFMNPQSPLETCRPFIQYVIAGYQGGLPRAYIVQFDIQWNEKRLIGPTRVLIHPPERGQLNFAFYSFGIVEAITDITNRDSYAYKADNDPMSRIRERGGASRHLSHEAVAMSRVLVQIEEEINPSRVGGEVKCVAITGSGAHEVANPLSRARETKSKAKAE